MSIEAMKQALEAFAAIRWSRHVEYAKTIATNASNDLRQAIQQSALDQIAQNERELGIGLQELMTHTDHPLRHYDRTCPACLAEKQELEISEKDKQIMHDVAMHYANKTKKMLSRKAEAQEPVAWVSEIAEEASLMLDKPKFRAIPIYAEPQVKAWVGLTDEKIFDTLKSMDNRTVRLPLGLKYFARAIEAKLKERNNG